MSAREKDCCDSVTTIAPRSTMSDLPAKSEFLIYERGELRRSATHKEILSVRRKSGLGAK